jgi:glycosyltransferase involved in cell wall biosynthesis
MSLAKINEGLVSTIIPVYNRPKLLHEAVESVLAQTYRPIEIIIVDDGSTDDTPKVADELAAQFSDIQVIHQKNAGPGRAREMGRLSASGEFLQYLDSDDILLPKKFELQVAGLREHPECGVSYGKTRYYVIGEIPENIPLKRTGELILTMFPAFLRSRWWSTSTPLIRRTVSDNAGPWSSLRNEEDWEYDCRIASQGIKLHYCDAFVSDTRDHSHDRLCRAEAGSLRDRAEAHSLIAGHAFSAGITDAFPEMQYFARELFLLSRQCGAKGLTKESEKLFQLSRKASGESRGKGWDFRTYEFVAKIVGWTMLGKVACMSDRFRK